MTSKTASPPSDLTLNLGEVLRRSGVVSQDQIDAAVVVVAQKGCRLGEALVSIGACDVAAVDVALDRQRRMRDPNSSTMAALSEIFDDAALAIDEAASKAVAAAAVHVRRSRGSRHVAA